MFKYLKGSHTLRISLYYVSPEGKIKIKDKCLKDQSSVSYKVIFLKKKTIAVRNETSNDGIDICWR